MYIVVRAGKQEEFGVYALAASEDIDALKAEVIKDAFKEYGIRLDGSEWTETLMFPSMYLPTTSIQYYIREIKVV